MADRVKCNPVPSLRLQWQPFHSPDWLRPGIVAEAQLRANLEQAEPVAETSPPGGLSEDWCRLLGFVPPRMHPRTILNPDALVFLSNWKTNTPTPHRPGWQWHVPHNL